MFSWLAGPWAKIQAGMAVAGAVIVAIGIVFLKGRKAGIEHMQAEQAARRIEAVEQRNQIEDDINALGAQDVDERLKRWNRVED